jgi:hypothetical protein
MFFIFTNTPPTFDQQYYVSKFLNYGYQPLVDGIHNSDYNWFVNNFKNSYRFYNVDENKKVYSYTVEDLNPEMYIPVLFAVVYNDDEIVDNERWSQIRKFIEDMLTDPNSANAEGLNLFTPTSVVPILNPIAVNTELSDRYELRYQYIDAKDIMIYEIVKPNVDLPYVTLVRNFSTNGHTEFFTNLFVCPSWGIVKEDIGFLKQVWKEFRMRNEFNLEKLMKEATEKCYPQTGKPLQCEPEVYRKSMEQVLHRFKARERC